MKNAVIKFLRLVAKPFMGKGLIDKHAPFLLKAFQQLYIRIQKKEIIQVTIPLDAQLKVYSTDIGVGLPLLLKGTYEPKETQLFLDSIHNGNIIFDIGANIGYYTVLASKKAGQRGKVFAFEPDRQNLSLLKENLSINDCKNVTIIDKALTDQNTKLAFHEEPYNKGESAISYEKSGKYSYTVEGISLDTFISQEKISHIDVIKMDIEGAEIGVLKGAKTFFTKIKGAKLFIEYNPSSIKRYGNSPGTMLALLEELDVTITHIIDEPKGVIIPFSKDELNYTLTHTTYCNLVCFF